jgi:methylmalonyl-CoA mutase
MYIHAETCHWNKSVYDPYVNVLRSTTEGMSAALGGVNSITVTPFDLTFENPADLAERVARNTQIILQEESYFDKNIDPSAGSYYIENLTDSIVTAAWKLFLEVQEKGGFVSAFRDGFIQSKINDLAAKRIKAIATRREILLGTNQFPNINEIIDKDICDLSYDLYLENKDGGLNNGECIAEPLRFFRGGEDFEHLRQITDKWDRRPKVFMLSIGNVAMRKARASFACNFFACAGFQVLDNDGFLSVDEGIKVALNEKSDIIVICSSDEEYSALAPDAFTKLENKAIFVVAGDPASKPDLEAKGIKNFISVKSNVLEELKRYQGLLNITVQ